MTGIMSVNSTVCLYLLFFLIKNVCCRSSNDFASQRITRDSLREYASDDPNFWPVRGRRDDDRNLVSLHAGDSDGFGPVPRGGRKSKEKETGVFWAGRGRSFRRNDVFGTEEDNFWAHRGRSADPESGERWNYPEEPGWVLVARRESKMQPHPEDYDTLFCLKGGKPYKNERIHENVCHLKRKSNKYLRDISQSEQFWPVRGKKSDGYLLRDKAPIKAFPLFLEDDPFLPLRGKKEKESWQDDLNNLKSFWPSRGKRPQDQIIAKD